MTAETLPLEITQVSVTAILAAMLAWWMARHPNRKKTDTLHYRLPKFIAILGWVYIALAAVFAIFATDASGLGDAGMRAMSLGFFAFGVLCIAVYRNWYIAPDTDEVRFRSLFGREQVIVYSDITNYSIKQNGNNPRITIRTSRGVTLGVNLRFFDMSPLLAAIAFRDERGRWPLRGELPPAPPRQT